MHSRKEVIHFISPLSSQCKMPAALLGLLEMNSALVGLNLSSIGSLLDT
jgi:hypothetical protein